MPKEFPEVGFEPGYYPDNEEGAGLFNQGLEAGGEIVDLLLLACDNDAHKARVFYTQWEESARFPAYVKDLMNGLIEEGDIALQGAQDGQALKEGQESSPSVCCVDSLVDELNKEGPQRVAVTAFTLGIYEVFFGRNQGLFGVFAIPPAWVNPSLGSDQGTCKKLQSQSRRFVRDCFYSEDS